MLYYHMNVVQNFVTVIANCTTSRSQFTITGNLAHSFWETEDVNWKLTFLFFGVHVRVFYLVLFIKKVKVFNSLDGRGVKHIKRSQEHKLLVDICGSKPPALKPSLTLTLTLTLLTSPQ